MQYCPPNANLDSGCQTVSVVTVDMMFVESVDTSWWSYLANFVGHSIGWVRDKLIGETQKSAIPAKVRVYQSTNQPILRLRFGYIYTTSMFIFS